MIDEVLYLNYLKFFKEKFSISPYENYCGTNSTMINMLLDYRKKLTITISVSALLKEEEYIEMKKSLKNFKIITFEEYVENELQENLKKYQPQLINRVLNINS